MQRTEIFAAVSAGIEKAAQTRAAKFKWTLVPAKSLADGGLGLGFNAYHLFLHDLFTAKLPQKKPFTLLQVDPLLLRDTHAKPLTSLRNALMDRLDAAAETKFDPARAQAGIRRQRTRGGR